jgi:ABC-2 type transport system permease protein
MQGNSRKKKAPRVARAGQAAASGRAMPLAGIEQRIPATLRALLFKDYLVLRRDLRNLSQLVTPLIFGIVYAIMFLRQGSEPPAGQGEAPAWFMEIMKNLMLYGNVAISLFVGWMLLSRLAGMGFSQEGKSYWMLKTAPISVRQLITAKFLVAFLPALALGWLFLLGISLVQRASLQVLLFSMPVVALCIAGNTGINLTFGVLGANFNWEDPRHMQRGGIGCLGMIASIAYLPLSLLLFFGPAVGLSLLQISEGIGQLAGLLTGGLFSLACAIVPLWLVRNRVPLLNEE